MQLGVVSINAGRPSLLRAGRRTVLSAIRKAPIAGAVWLSDQGLATDEQADRGVHGGADKALCFYPVEHLARWSAELQLAEAMAPGAFGENVTTAGLDETTVNIGDVYSLGTAIVEVSQPRTPCFRLSAVHRRQDLVRRVAQLGRTGWYCRVLEPGTIAQRPGLALLERGQRGVSVAMAFGVAVSREADRRSLARVLDEPRLSDDWREGLLARLGAGSVA